MNVAVIGAGYVGLVTGTGLAYLGHTVRMGEADSNKLRILSAGQVPFFEAGLDQMLSEGIDNGLLTFHSDNKEAVAGARVVFVALPTPPDEDGSADTSYIEGALDDFGPILEPGTVVVLKSTVPVGSRWSMRALALVTDSFPANPPGVSSNRRAWSRAICWVLWRPRSRWRLATRARVRWWPVGRTRCRPGSRRRGRYARGAARGC